MILQVGFGVGDEGLEEGGEIREDGLGAGGGAGGFLMDEEEVPSFTWGDDHS